MRHLVVAVSLLASCHDGSRPAPAGDAGPSVSWTPDFAPLEADLARERAALAALPCARPPLRGDPLPGAAADDLRALEGGGISPLTVCLGRTFALRRVVARRACASVGGKLTQDCAPREVPTEARAELDALVAACAAPVERAVAQATGHADGCRADRGHPVPPAQDGRVLDAAFQVAVAAETEPPGDAARHLLDVVALGLDHMRGGDALDMSVGASVGLVAVRGLQQLVRARPLTAAELDALAAELDRALASAPPLHDTWHVDMVEVMTDAAARREDAHAAKEAWFTCKGARATLALMDAACPAGGAPGPCLEALSRPATRSLDPIVVTAQHAIPAFAKQGRVAYGAMLAGLHEVALEVATRRWIAAAGRCPTAADFAAPPLAARVAPPSLGMALAVAEDGDAWRVTGPPTVSPDGATPWPLGRFACQGGAWVAPPPPVTAPPPSPRSSPAAP